ncbi:MAG: hemerythrin family protein [Thermodesulfobacteriota bacterium]
MDEFTWKDAYSVDNATIDQEHRHLFAMANQVFRFRSRGERLERVREAVVALCDYIKNHFLHEEAFMAEAGYPGLPAHRVLHEAIIHEMNETLRTSNDLDLLVYKLKRLMLSWVIEHIQEADRHIGLFLRRQSGDAPPDPTAAPP